MRQLVTAIATGLYTGFIPTTPGTFGTMPAWLIAFFLVRGDQRLLVAVLVVSFLLSVWSAGKAEAFWGHDAKKIVIDEWVGMFVALVILPFTLKAYIIAFFAFRFFDVVKLWPAGASERLPGGWGVTMDDVVAGAQANIATQVIVLVLAWLHW
jgi:phosphatidylglycerophosphatase A